MLSKFYIGDVTHQRSEPMHGFSYRVCYAWIDLDEIDEFCGSRYWLSKEGFNVMSFYRQDYLPGEEPLGDTVKKKIFEKTGERFVGKVFALTTLRQLGVCVNPISLFYCYSNTDQHPSFVVVEVHNTPWDERHTYILQWDSTGKSVRQLKELHVSPFMPMDLEYEFDLPVPGEELGVRIRVLRSGDPVFNAALDLQSLPLHKNIMRRVLLKSGWQPLIIVVRIYFQALCLWLKNARFFHHPDRSKITPQHRRNGIL